MALDMNPMRPPRPVYHPPIVINTPLPADALPPPDLAPNSTPMDGIRGLLKRLRGQSPTPAGPPPEADPRAPAAPPPMKSVLKNAPPNS